MDSLKLKDWIEVRGSDQIPPFGTMSEGLEMNGLRLGHYCTTRLDLAQDPIHPTSIGIAFVGHSPVLKPLGLYSPHTQSPLPGQAEQEQGWHCAFSPLSPSVFSDHQAAAEREGHCS